MEKKVHGLKEAVALAMNSYDWTHVRTLLECNIAKESVEYKQLQQIHVNENIIEVSCLRGFTELVSVFLNNGFQVNCIVDKSTERRMLHLSVITGHFSLVKLLLNVGADIHCKTCEGDTPLLFAVLNYHLEVVKYLISVGIVFNTYNKNGKVLVDAALHGGSAAAEILQHLLVSDRDPRKTFPFSFLGWIVRNEKINFVQTLLNAAAHINSKNTEMPLYEPTQNGNIPIMQLLLDYGSDISEKDKLGNTALHLAVISGNLESVKFLIDRGSLINTVNNKQETPLLLSFDLGHFDVATQLINSGADLTLCLHDKVLNIALCDGAPINLIECLLEHGANVTAEFGKMTALQFVFSHYQIRYDNAESLHLVKLLLIYGSNHYVKDENGNSVFHWACGMGDLELVNYLIESELNVDAKNKEGKKPIDIANEKGYNSIVSAIIEYHCNKYSSFD